MKSNNLTPILVAVLTVVLVTVACFVVGSLSGCNSNPGERITTEKVIPDSLKIEAADRLHQLIQAASVNSRAEDEDWDDFVRAAHQVIRNMYGVPVWGVSIDYGGFVPYELCSPAQKKMIDNFLKEDR